MSEFAIKTKELGKMYKLFRSPGDKILDAFGLLPRLPWKKNAYHEFWALQDISVEIGRGQQIGIIGSNGAGKSTLLKLISGNITPTRGAVEVHGKIQALMDLGSGFHPEFSGFENIRASLSYQGLSSDEIKEAEYEIAEFTELGQFLDQPIKTYSSGMLARLSFTTSTVINPEILIIDEILGAGDAYFISKSKDRMRKLIDSGASILLVSHSLDQITQFCTEAIWIERGRMIQRGPSMEVVKAYEQFVRVRTDRRLKAINYQRQTAQDTPKHYLHFGETLILRYVLEGKPGSSCDISEVKLLKNGEIEESLRVGDVQDSSSYHQAFIQLEGSDWSRPHKEEDVLFRSFTIPRLSVTRAAGNVAFSLFAFFKDAEYTVETDYRLGKSGRLHVEVWRNGVMQSKIHFESEAAGWTKEVITIAVAESKPEDSSAQPEHLKEGGNEDISARASEESIAVRRWPSEGSLTIEKVEMFDEEGNETAVFQAGSQLTIKITFMSHKSKLFEVLPSIGIYRLDGILVTKYPENEQIRSVQLESGQTHIILFNIGPLNLGDANYVLSIALFQNSIDENQRYDVIDRSYEFQIVGNNEIMAQTICHIPGTWCLLSDDKNG